MSFGARLLPGTVSLLFGAMLVFMAPDVEHRWGFYGFGAFCLSIGLACFTTGRVRDLLGSLIASTVVMAGIAYLVAQISSGPVISGSTASPSIVNALLFNVVFSLPAIVYLWRAQFGFGNRATPPSPQRHLHRNALGSPAPIEREPRRPR